MPSSLSVLPRRNLGLALACGCLLLSGCASSLSRDPLQRGPFFTPTNATGEASLPSDLRRVIVLPLHGGELAPAESCAALEPVFVAGLRRDFAVDAVMFVEFTAFTAYRPLTLGVRAKLAVVADSHLVWAFDNIFAAENPAVANSARRFFAASDRREVPGDLTPAVLQSPSRFAEYVAAAMYATLPPVYSPTAGVAKGAAR